MPADWPLCVTSAPFGCDVIAMRPSTRASGSVTEWVPPRLAFSLRDTGT